MTAPTYLQISATKRSDLDNETRVEAGGFERDARVGTHHRIFKLNRIAISESGMSACRIVNGFDVVEHV